MFSCGHCENIQSAAVVINPVFTYSWGKLHSEEQKPVDLLAKGNHNLDWQFSILFKDKSDDRDLCPMVYSGRFVFPSPLGGPKQNLFFICELRKPHRTEEVKQLAAKVMKLVKEREAAIKDGSFVVEINDEEPKSS